MTNGEACTYTISTARPKLGISGTGTGTGTRTGQKFGTRPSRWRPGTALVLAAALLAPISARAQRTAADVESARELYAAGRELRDHGDLRGALEKFKAAHALGHTPITGLELAQTYDALGQPVEAREVCLGIARMPVTPEETSRSAEARVLAAKLAEAVKPKIATLRVLVRGIPAGSEASLVIDGARIPAAAIGQPRQVDPGTHAIVGRVGGGPETTQSVELKEGEVRDVEIVIVPPRAPADGSAPPAAQAHEERRLSPLVIPGFAVAVVGVAAGTVTGILALSGKSDLDAKCVSSHCGPDAYDALDRARTMGTVSTVAFIVGGVGAAVGIYGLTRGTIVTRRTGTEFVHPYVGAGSFGVDGAF